jgi:hypothetical protein
MELLAEHCFDGLARAVIVLLNEVMQLRRCAILRAGSYQRSEHRNGYTTGYR